MKLINKYCYYYFDACEDILCQILYNFIYLKFKWLIKVQFFLSFDKRNAVQDKRLYWQQPQQPQIVVVDSCERVLRADVKWRWYKCKSKKVLDTPTYTSNINDFMYLVMSSQLNLDLCNII